MELAFNVGQAPQRQGERMKNMHRHKHECTHMHLCSVCTCAQASILHEQEFAGTFTHKLLPKTFYFPLISLSQLIPFFFISSFFSSFSPQFSPLLISLPPLSAYFLHKSFCAPFLCQFLPPHPLFLAVFLPSVLPALPHVSDLL